jgi:hypothetical protein
MCVILQKDSTDFEGVKSAVSHTLYGVELEIGMLKRG